MGNFALRLSFFDRALSPLYSSYHAQTYFGVVLYLFIAMALCGLLATIAYLFSLSSVQDSEKRSEYECGFEPFDSATRLPFDVHFYLVGILFLIFDVEIALLFPWVLSLRTTGWFGFYLMLGFILLLAIGFLYEWKLGALIWPARQQEATYTFVGRPKQNGIFGVIVFIVFVLLVFIWLIMEWSDQEYQKFHAALRASVATRKNPTKTWVDEIITFFRVVGRTYLDYAPRAIYLFYKHLPTSFYNLLANIPGYLKRSWGHILMYYPINKDKLLAEAKSVLNKLRLRAEVRWEKVKKAIKDKWSFVFPTVVAEEGTSSSMFPKILDCIEKADDNFINCIKKYFFKEEDFVVETGLYYVKTTVERPDKDSPAVVVWAPEAEQLVIKVQQKCCEPCFFLIVLMYVVLFISAWFLMKVIREEEMERQRYANRGLPKRGTKSSGVLVGSVLFSDTIPYAFQFFSELLPEMALVAMIMFILAVLSFEVGNNTCKKLLSVESLLALRLGMAFVLILYVIQGLYMSTAVLFNGYMLSTLYVLCLKFLTLFSGRFVLSNSLLFVQQHKRPLLEYPVVLTLALLFMVLLVGSGHLFSAFLALVGFSLNLYVLVLFDAPSATAREAGIKYFYLSTISSGLLIYGIFLLFLTLGTCHFFETNHILSVPAALSFVSIELVRLGLVFALIALFFKLSAFPGHLWAADVYEGSPDPIMAFFMLPVKVAVLAFITQMLASAFEPATAFWQLLVVVSTAVSLVWGCFAALVEKKTKRFLAYASINQIGFLMLGLASGSFEGYRTTIFYLTIYAIMNIGFLTIFLFARRDTGSTSYAPGGLVYITDMRGLGFSYGKYSWSLASVLLSMAGIPPLAGFFGKYYLLLHAMEQGLYGIIIIALITSLVSTYYYLRLIKVLWFESTDGMVAVSCDLPKCYARSLTVAEWALWGFLFYVGFFIDGLDALIIDLYNLLDISILPETVLATPASIGLWFKYWLCRGFGGTDQIKYYAQKLKEEREAPAIAAREAIEMAPPTQETIQKALHHVPALRDELVRSIEAGEIPTVRAAKAEIVVYEHVATTIARVLPELELVTWSRSRKNFYAYIEKHNIPFTDRQRELAELVFVSMEEMPTNAGIVEILYQWAVYFSSSTHLAILYFATLLYLYYRLWLREALAALDPYDS